MKKPLIPYSILKVGTGILAFGVSAWFFYQFAINKTPSGKGVLEVASQYLSTNSLSPEKGLNYALETVKAVSQLNPKPIPELVTLEQNLERMLGEMQYSPSPVWRYALVGVGKELENIAASFENQNLTHFRDYALGLASFTAGLYLCISGARRLKQGAK